MSRRGDRQFLLDILEAYNRIIDFTKDISYDEFVEDIKTQDAVLRNIEILGEAVKNISDELKKQTRRYRMEKDCRNEGQTDKLLFRSEFRYSLGRCQK